MLVSYILFPVSYFLLLTSYCLLHTYHNKKFFLLLTSYLLLHTFSFAQTVSATLDRDKILLGEQVTLKITLTELNESLSFVAALPQINDTVNHIEVVKRNAVDTIKVNNTNSYQQIFTLTSFDSGRWQLGPFYFTIQDKTTGKKTRLNTEPLFITVLTVDVSSMKDYHPLKDIIDVETSFNWLPVIIAVAVIVAAIIIFIIIKNRKKKIKETPKVVLKGTALERAIEKLQILEKEPLTSTEAIKKFHSEIDFITRQYFEEMTQVKALQLTTTELFHRMHVYMQDAKLRSKFQQVFETNAAVKFAKYMPQQDESKNILKETINSLQQIDNLVNAARNNANRMV